MKAFVIVCLFNILLLFTSCTDHQQHNKQMLPTAGQTASFPNIPYRKVILIAIDSTYYDVTDLHTLETKVMTAGFTNGLAFVDSTAKPVNSHYKKHELIQKEIDRLKSLFEEKPCDNGMTGTTMCIPVYRDVLVFYDEKEKPVAQVQICFSCHQIIFHPDKEGLMCDFFYKGDWKALKTLVNDIKSN